MYLYQLWHEYYVAEGDYDNITEIAIYSSHKRAKIAIKKFSSHPKFKEHPDGFNIAKIEVNSDDWKEGFDTYR